MNYRTIETVDELNIHKLNIIKSPQYGKSILLLRPFTNCYPYGREGLFKKWNEIACQMYKSELTTIIREYTVKIEVKSNGQENIFEISAEARDMSFTMEEAIKAIKEQLRIVVNQINPMIELALNYYQILKYFPELNFKALISNIESKQKELKDMVNGFISQIEILSNRIERIEKRKGVRK